MHPEVEPIHVTGAGIIFASGFFLAAPKPKVELLAGKYNNKSRRVAMTGSEYRRRLWRRV